MKKERVIVVGSGPAGLTAALYAARDQLEPLVIAGPTIGGQVSLTNEVENYPGFPEGLGGPDLVEKMQKQAEKFGARFEFDEVTELELPDGGPFYVKTYGQEYEADALILTMGASPRLLKVPGEQEFTGRGVSYCATCDGFFFRGKDVIVVGGGDSAMEEGIFLTRFADHVQVIHRRDELRAGPVLAKRAMSNEKIAFTWDSVVEEIYGDDFVEGVKLRNVKTDTIEDYATEGVFIFIGHLPNSQIVEGKLELDERGYIVTDPYYRTSIEGVFAGGEIQDPIFRQVATSVGQGCGAAMSCERWLAEHEA
jgi:thioredoxin reductase (NADPH)